MSPFEAQLLAILDEIMGNQEMKWNLNYAYLAMTVIQRWP